MVNPGVLTDLSLDTLVAELEATLRFNPAAPGWWRSCIERAIQDAHELELRCHRLMVADLEGSPHGKEEG